MLQRLQSEIERSIQVKHAILADLDLLSRIEEVTNVVVDALTVGGRVFFGGNGGSAADAQHLAAEFVSRLAFDRPGLAAQSLATDTPILTAIGNDYGYERVFARQIQANGRRGDGFIGITTSGRSKNIIVAFEECRNVGISAVALAGRGGDLEGTVDYVLRVPSEETARIQESHIMIGHIICAEVE